MSTVYQNIRRQRLLCNLTQEHVAKQLNLSIRQVGALERGEVRVHLKLLAQIAVVLETDVSTLLGVPIGKPSEAEDPLDIYIKKIRNLSKEEQGLIFQLIEQLEKKRDKGD